MPMKKLLETQRSVLMCLYTCIACPCINRHVCRNVTFTLKDQFQISCSKEKVIVDIAGFWEEALIS